MGWGWQAPVGTGGIRTPKRVSPSELAADGLQQASTVTPRKAAAKTGREMISKHVLFLRILFF